jgi:PleD family two-component response regulator
VDRLHFAIVAAVLPTLSLLAGQLSALRKRLKQQTADLQQALERIQRLATRDELTGLYNRRHLRHELAREAERAQRQRAPLALCLIGVDHFKPINDQHGHALGDEVLCGLSDLLLRLTRSGDILALYRAKAEGPDRVCADPAGISATGSAAGSAIQSGA